MCSLLTHGAISWFVCIREGSGICVLYYLQAAQVVPTEQQDKKKGGKGKGKGSSGKVYI